MPDRAPSPASLPRNVWVVTLTSFFTDISSEMLIDLMPLFLANVLGARTDVIGLIEGIAESTSSLLKIVSGWLSDRLGQRKSLALAGYALSSVTKPFMYFVIAWPGALAVRFADRLGKGVRTAPRDALIADTIDEKRRGLAFGLHRAGDTAGAFFGLLAALVIVWVTQANELDLERGTYQRIVLLGTIPALVAVLTLFLGAKDVSVAKRGELPRLSLRGMDGRFRRFMVVLVLFTLGNSSDAFLILRAQERGLTVPGILGMLATFNFVYAALAGPAGALSDRIGRRRVLIFGWLVYGLLYLGFGASGEWWQVWALYGLYGIYYATTDGVAKAYVADLVVPEQRGTAYGIYNAAVGLAAFPASLIAGVLWQGVGTWPGLGPAAPFIFGSALAILSVMALSLWVPVRAEPGQQPPSQPDASGVTK